MKKPRRNQAQFMTKELRNAIMDRSRLKNKYLKWQPREKVLAYKKPKNICNSLNKKANKTTLKKLRGMELCVIESFEIQSKLFLHQKGSFTMITFR